jgi:hypothetical protein
MLDAEGGDRHRLGVRRQHQIVGERAILLAAFDDLAALDVNRAIGNILDRKLAHVSGFMHDHFPRGQRLFEREVIALDRVGTMDEIDRQILVRVRAGEVRLVRDLRRLRDG